MLHKLHTAQGKNLQALPLSPSTYFFLMKISFDRTPPIRHFTYILMRKKCKKKTENYNLTLAMPKAPASRFEVSYRTMSPNINFCSMFAPYFASQSKHELPSLK